MDATGSRRLLRDPNLHIVFSVTLMAVMGVTSVTPAFPTIMRALDITETQVGLLVTVFTLPGVFLTAGLGVVADRYGRKRILVPSLVVFGVFGAACALARDFTLLLGLRLVQGVGAAGLGALNMTVLGDLYEGRRLATAMGYNATVLSTGTLVYPALGGALAASAWYWPFALPIVAVPLALVVLWGLDNPEPTSDAHLRDYFAGLWDFVRDRRVLGLFSASVLIFVLLYGAILTFLPILMDRSFGASPVAIGLVLSAMSVGSGAASAVLGRLTGRFATSTLVRAGLATYAVTLLWFAWAPSMWWLVAPSVLYGIANGLAIPTIITMLSADASISHRGAVLSTNGMLLRTGQTIGPLLMGALFVAGGLDLLYWVSAGIALVTLALVVVLVRDTPDRSPAR